MIAPLSQREIQLIQLLVEQRHDADTVTRLRTVLAAMDATDELSEACLQDLIDGLTKRYRGNPTLSALHEDTCALLRAAAQERAALKSAG